MSEYNYIVRRDGGPEDDEYEEKIKLLIEYILNSDLSQFEEVREDIYVIPYSFHKLTFLIMPNMDLCFDANINSLDLRVTANYGRLSINHVGGINKDGEVYGHMENFCYFNVASLEIALVENYDTEVEDDLDWIQRLNICQNGEVKIVIGYDYRDFALLIMDLEENILEEFNCDTPVFNIDVIVFHELLLPYKK